MRNAEDRAHLFPNLIDLPQLQLIVVRLVPSPPPLHSMWHLLLWLPSAVGYIMGICIHLWTWVLCSGNPILKLGVLTALTTLTIKSKVRSCRDHSIKPNFLSLSKEKRKEFGWYTDIVLSSWWRVDNVTYQDEEKESERKDTRSCPALA